MAIIARMQRIEGGGLVESFLASQTMRGLSPATVERRRWTLRAFADELAPRSLGSASTDDVERFLGARRAPATRRALLGDLRAFYRWAGSRGHLRADPTGPVETPKVPRRLATPLSRDELRRAWDAAGFPMRCALALGAGAGLRVAEMSALELADVDFEHFFLTVRNGKGGRDRVVPMAVPLADLLRHAGPVKVLPWKSAESTSNAIRGHFRRLGIRHRPHDLRHTFATECARLSGGNMMVVADLMGHSSIATTQRYTAALPGGRELVEALWALEAA